MSRPNPHTLKQPLVSAVVVTMICAMAASFINWHRNYDDEWFQGRALAESVKTATWRYMMRVEPFTSDAESDREFTQRLGTLLRDCEDVNLESGEMSIDGLQITGRMREVRRLSVSERFDVYLRDRLNHQIAWYLERSRHNGRLAGYWFLASFGAELVALAIALVAMANHRDDRSGRHGRRDRGRVRRLDGEFRPRVGQDAFETLEGATGLGGHPAGDEAAVGISSRQSGGEQHSRGGDADSGHEAASLFDRTLGENIAAIHGVLLLWAGAARRGMRAAE